MMPLATDNRLDTVQLLRALAALMVVLQHAQGWIGPWAAAQGLAFSDTPAIPLVAGVDLFFVISGFIIVFASERFFAEPGGGFEFFRRRIYRIVPLWWFALSLRVAALFAAGLFGVKVMPSAMAIGASYAFIPYDGMGYGSHFPFPVLDLGWSLNYELLFYALFACAMWLPRLHASVTVAVFLFVGVLAVWFHPPDSVPLWFWFQPIVVEFTFGIGLALLFRQGVRLGAVPRIVVAAAGVGLWLFVDIEWFGVVRDGPGRYDWPRALIYGGGAALILAGAVLGRTEIRHPLLLRASALGDSSYALYLLHPFVIMAFRLTLPLVSPTAAVLWPVVGLMVIISVLVAERFHHAIEKPIVDRLQKIRFSTLQSVSNRP